MQREASAWNLHLWHILAFGGEDVEQRGWKRAQSPCGCDEEHITCMERATSRVGGGGLEELEQEGKRCE